VAIKGARIVAVDGPTLEEGTVLVRGGKIVAVGKDVKVPYDAKAIDGSGKTVFPGMINAHTGRGLDRANESLPVTPFLDVFDSLDPSSYVFEDALRDGVTTLNVMPGNDTVVGGVGRAVYPLGLTVDAMTVRAPTALKISMAGKSGFDRVQQRAALREVFLELEAYLEDVAEKRYEETEKEAGREVKVAPEEARKKGRPLVRVEDLDDKHRNLWLLTQGKLDAFVACPEPRDVSFGVALAKEHGFLARTTFVLGSGCFKAAKELAAAGRPVVLPPGLTHRELDPETGEEVETFVPSAFAAAKVPFAMQTFISSSFAERYLWYQAARCVREGIDRQTALESITLAPARILGLQDRLGGVTPGRDADLLILSGDPLSAKTQVETVLIGGKVVYEREKDFRLRRLLSGEGNGGGMAEEHDVHDEDEHEEPEKGDSAGGAPAEPGPSGEGK
jgi:imidazolonepropionase-like amidohydrolase